MKKIFVQTEAESPVFAKKFLQFFFRKILWSNLLIYEDALFSPINTVMGGEKAQSFLDSKRIMARWRLILQGHTYMAVAAPITPIIQWAHHHVKNTGGDVLTKKQVLEARAAKKKQKK